MQPTRPRSLHRFDARSLVLFASLTMGGSQAIMAQNLHPSPAQGTTPASVTEKAAEAPQLPAPTPDQAFDRADANGDGKLTLREAERYPAIAERFSQFDTDKNGSLSRTEFNQGLKHN